MVRASISVTCLVLSAASALAETPLTATDLTPVPENARLVFTEDWSSGQINSSKWYLLRKQ
jgi:hypothetical protein